MSQQSIKTLFLFVLATILLISNCSTDSASPAITEADYILHGGTIHTVNPQQPEVKAIAVKNNRIIFAGSLQEINAMAGSNTPKIDLNGYTLIPGFNEGHGHLMGLGYELSEIDLSEVDNYQAIVDIIKNAVQNAKPNEWIIGNSWHQSKWNKTPAEMIKGFQTNKLLNEVSPNNPVLLKHASGHAIFVNNKALELAGVDSTTEVSEDSEIIKDEQGNPTGILTENAQNLIYAVAPKPDQASHAKALTNVMNHLARWGITSFQDAGSEPDEIETFRQFADNNQLTSRIYVMLGGWNQDLLNQWYTTGPEVDDNHWLTVRGIKLVADGALGSRGAWLIKDYNDRESHYGNPVMSMDSITQLSQTGVDKGFQIAVHAIGDRANREVLNLFAELSNEKDDLRLRVEHAQHLHPDDIELFGKHNIIASMQGIHMSSDRPWAINRLGIERIKSGAYMWRALLDSKAVLVNGTDVPVEPINPIASYYALVTRQTLAGTPKGGYEPAQKISREEALHAYTLAPAYATFEERVKGSIEEGKLADFTLLSQDILSVDDTKLLNTAIIATIVDGKLVYCDQANQTLCTTLSNITGK